MPEKIRKVPLCEACGVKPASSFSRLRDGGLEERWLFTCDCFEHAERPIQFSCFFEDSDVLLAYFEENPWLDWMDFNEMIDRYDEATGGVISRLAAAMNTDTYRNN